MLRSLSVLSLSGALFSLTPALSVAQTQAENVAAARALGIQGVQLADEGRCAEAIGPLERAESLYHAPSILGRLGECQVAVGQLVLGTENLNRTVREPLGPNAPQAFRDAQARAQKVLESTLPRIPKLVIHVEPAAAGAKVLIGETQVPPALFGAERPTDPGVHHLTATAPGYLPAQSSVTLAEGTRQEITLTLVPDPVAAAPAAPSPPATTGPSAPAPDSPPATGRRSNTAGFVLLGVGGAGLIAGGVTGLLALNKENELACPDYECPQSEHDTLDQARTLALISTVGFGVGIAGAIAGTVVLLTGDGSEPAPSSQTAWRPRPFLRGQSVGIEGSF